MARGITFTADQKVTIDLKKYGEELYDFFCRHNVGEKATKSIYSKKFIAKMNKSIEEARRGELKTVDVDNLFK